MTRRRGKLICGVILRRKCSPALPISHSTGWTSNARIWSPALGASSILARTMFSPMSRMHRRCIEAEGDAIAHMNSDHAEACRLYATKLLGAGDGDWACVGIDPEGLGTAARPHGVAAVLPAARHRAGAAARDVEATRRRGTPELGRWHRMRSPSPAPVPPGSPQPCCCTAPAIASRSSNAFPNRNRSGPD